VLAPVDPATGTGAAFERPIRNFRPFRRSRPGLLIVVAFFVTAGVFAIDQFVVSKRGAHSGRSSTPIVPPAAPAQNTIPEKSIAVLPFVDMSEKKDQEYFGDGMAEEILNLLVTIPDLKVIGRTSSFQFKDKTSDLRKIGAALGAAYIVEGSVRRFGDQVRVTAQLIDTRDGAHRWSDTYDRNASDVLKVQDEIAASLVRALQLEMTASGHIRAQTSLRSGDAYDSYLRGLHALDRHDQRGFDGAVADFRRALELDPAFVAAAEALARALRNLADDGFVPPRTGWNQAREAAEAALKLDPKSARAHAILGNIFTAYDWNWPAAASELQTALALAPSDSEVLSFAAVERGAVGDFSEAMRLLDAANAADPLDVGIYLDRGAWLLRLGRFAEAETAYQRGLQIAPTHAWGHYYLGILLLTEGKAEAALAEMQKVAVAGAQAAGLAVVYQALHRTKDADAALARLEAQNAGDLALLIAEAYAFRGQKDSAFRWLERAYVQKDISFTLLMGDPLLKKLAGDPRYTAFLRKMNLPQ
jgi:adenylate cyclase